MIMSREGLEITGALVLLGLFVFFIFLQIRKNRKEGRVVMHDFTIDPDFSDGNAQHVEENIHSTPSDPDQA